MNMYWTLLFFSLFDSTKYSLNSINMITLCGLQLNMSIQQLKKYHKNLPQFPISQE